MICAGRQFTQASPRDLPELNLPVFLFIAFRLRVTAFLPRVIRQAASRRPQPPVHRRALRLMRALR